MYWVHIIKSKLGFSIILTKRNFFYGQNTEKVTTSTKTLLKDGNMVKEKTSKHSYVRFIYTVVFNTDTLWNKQKSNQTEYVPNLESIPSW